MNHIGNNIKRLRIAKGLLQEQLATLLDKKKGVVSKMENGAVVISLKDATKLSKIFEVSIDDLINGAVDASKVVETKKSELSQYNIKTLHPTIDKDFNNLPPDLKAFGKAMALEIYREFAGVTIDQLKQEASNDCINDIESILTGTYSYDEEIRIDQVIQLIHSLKTEIV